MRKIAGSLALTVLLVTGAWAQRGMGGGYRGGGARGGGFSGGHAVSAGRGFVGGGLRTGGYGVRLGYGTGFGGFRGGFRGFHRGFGFRGFYAPYSYWWPSYSLDFGYYGSGVTDFGAYYGYPYYGYSYPAYGYAPSYPQVVSAYQPETPPVVISQQFSTPPQSATPVIREYGTENQGQQAPADSGSSYSTPGSNSNQGSSVAQGATIYLIAMTDGVIRPALTYWAQGTTLNYLGLDHKQKQVPLDMVDRALSAQLNRERRVPFRLP